MAGPLLADRYSQPYDFGGYLPDGVSLVVGRGVEPEPVAPSVEELRAKIEAARGSHPGENPESSPVPAPSPVPQEQPPGQPATQEPPPPQPPIDPSRYTIQQIREHLTKHPVDLAAVTRAERAGRHRVRLLAWLEERADDEHSDESPAGDRAGDNTSKEEI